MLQWKLFKIVLIPLVSSQEISGFFEANFNLEIKLHFAKLNEKKSKENCCIFHMVNLIPAKSYLLLLRAIQIIRHAFRHFYEPPHGI
jgi:hypothetical protein